MTNQPYVWNGEVLEVQVLSIVEFSMLFKITFHDVGSSYRSDSYGFHVVPTFSL